MAVDCPTDFTDIGEDTCSGSCVIDCEYEFDEFEGNILLDLNCSPGATYTYTASLTLNGLLNSKEITCDPNPPTCDTLLTPSGWAPSFVATVTNCVDTPAGCYDDPSTPYAGCTPQPSCNESTKIVTTSDPVSVKTKDKAGNEGTCTPSPPAQIDNEAPTCVATLATTAWTNADVGTFVTCEDHPTVGGSGIKTCVIAPDPITVASGAFTDTATATGTATDNANNVGTCVTPAAKIDKIVPVFNSSCTSGGSAYPSAFPSGWTNQNVLCDLTLQDVNSQLQAWNVAMSSTGSGAQTTMTPLSATGQNTATVTQALTFSGEQERTYSFAGSLADNATNQTTLSSTINVKIDTTPPVIPGSNVIQLSNGGGLRTITSSPTTFEANEVFTMKINISDTFSGIDWDTSTISIDGGPVDLVETPFSSLSGGISFDVGTQTITFSNDTDIFEKKGLYNKIDFKFFDQAGNPGPVLNNLKVNIVASEIAAQYSTFTNQDTQDCGVADNSAECDFVLILKDRFNNSITQRGTITTTFNTQDINRYVEGYDLTTRDANQTFIDGLRFDGGSDVGTENQFIFNNTADQPEDVSIKALVPSMNILIGDSGEIVRGAVSGKAVSISLTAREVGLDGIISTTINQSPVLFGATLEFSPWVDVILNGANDTNIIGMNVLFQDPMDIWILANNGAGTLPANFDVVLKGHTKDSNLFFLEEDVTTGFSTSFSGSVAAESHSVETHLTSLPGVVTNDLRMSFSSKIKQAAIAGKTVIYPGQAYGDTGLPDQVGEVEGYFIGADIEGNILSNANKIIQEEHNESIFLGANQAKDIRENMNKNAANLIAGRTPTDISGMLDFSIADLVDGGVHYYKGGTLKLGTNFGAGTMIGGGKNTIIIEDGNLFIAENLAYASNTDSLGIILINSLISDSEHGNVFVSKDVQQFVGTYFTHGTITSTAKTATDTSSPEIVEGLDRDPDIHIGNDLNPGNVLNKQLLLNGTVFTRNTLGGSMINPMIDPWGKTPGTKEEAQRYDLHFVRRYTNKLKDGSDVLPENNYCVKNPINCDTNPHAFVIRPDGKVIDATTVPPGFEYFGTINTN